MEFLISILMLLIKIFGLFLRENVGIILLLESTRSQKILCIANTHILFNPKRGDAKLAQLMLFLAHLDRVAYRGLQTDQKKPEYHPTLVCGDFNMDFRSKLYEFMRTSRLYNFRCLNRNLLSGQLETTGSDLCIENTILPRELGISDKSQFKHENDKRFKTKKNQDIFGGDDIGHAFNFESVYKHHSADNSSFEVTICLDETKRTVDFIFFHSETDNATNESEMSLEARLELFTMSDLKNVVLPCKYYPSDHFMIAGKFCIH